MIGHEFESLTDLGKRYGVSSHVMGRWLAQLGLRRVGGWPTKKANDMGLYQQIPTGRGEGKFSVWHVQKTTVLLKAAGHAPTEGAGEETAMVDGAMEVKVPDPRLVGPFDLVLGGDGWQVVNRDRQQLVTAMTSRTAKSVFNLLQLAYRHRAKLLDWDGDDHNNATDGNK